MLYMYVLQLGLLFNLAMLLPPGKVKNQSCGPTVGTSDSADNFGRGIGLGIASSSQQLYVMNIVISSFRTEFVMRKL